jgi:hypothetical protein
MKVSLNNGLIPPTTAAGNGILGSGSSMLSGPYGIFVDIELNLYVADTVNHRIQLFQSGQINGTTIAGNGALGTVTLNYPAGIILDADCYLFIADASLKHIVGSGPAGYRCIVECSGESGTASNQFNAPYALSFDSFANMFVVDSDNNRIQKFLLATNSCGKYHYILLGT